MSSEAKQGPLLIPPYLIVGREETVVLEFDRDLPKTGFITLSFHDPVTGEQLSSVPTAQLGTRTLKAISPGFSRAGNIEVGIQFTRVEKSLFPHFYLSVLSPVEAIFKVVHSDKQDTLPLFSSLLSFLAHCNEGDNDNTDKILCSLLQSINPADLTEWQLGPLLCGNHGMDENILHFCTRRKLSEAALTLLQPHHVAGKASYILQKSSLDGKTPIELAHKNGLTRVAEVAENAMVGKKAAISKDKKRRSAVPRTSSYESNLHLESDVVQAGNTTPRKNKGGKWMRRLRGDAKDKEAKMPLQHQSSVTSGRDDLNSASEASVSPSHSASLTPAHTTASFTDFISSEQEHNVSRDNFSHSDDQTFIVNRDQPMPLPKSQPLQSGSPSTFDDSGNRDPSTRDSIVSLSPTPKTADATIQPRNIYSQIHIPHRKLSADSVTKTTLTDQALDVSVNDLKKQCIFVGVVTQEYTFSGSNSIQSPEFSVKVGDKVYVTEERDGVCMGMCKNHFRKFPSEILRTMTYSEIMEGAADIKEEMEEDDIDGIYKVPRNVPRLKEDEDIYNIPRNIPLVVGPSSESGDIYNVPRSILQKTDVNDEDNIYNIPRNTPATTDHLLQPLAANSDSEDDHEYDLPPEYPMDSSDLSDGYYTIVPSRETHSAFGGSHSQPVKTGSSALDTLMKIASSKPINVSSKKQEVDDDIYDRPVSIAPQSSLSILRRLNQSKLMNMTSSYPEESVKQERTDSGIYDYPTEKRTLFNQMQTEEQSSAVHGMQDTKSLHGEELDSSNVTTDDIRKHSRERLMSCPVVEHDIWRLPDRQAIPKSASATAVKHPRRRKEYEEILPQGKEIKVPSMPIEGTSESYNDKQVTRNRQATGDSYGKYPRRRRDYEEIPPMAEKETEVKAPVKGEAELDNDRETKNEQMASDLYSKVRSAPKEKITSPQVKHPESQTFASSLKEMEYNMAPGFNQITEKEEVAIRLSNGLTTNSEMNRPPSPKPKPSPKLQKGSLSEISENNQPITSTSASTPPVLAKRSKNEQKKSPAPVPKPRRHMTDNLSSTVQPSSPRFYSLDRRSIAGTNSSSVSNYTGKLHLSPVPKKRAPAVGPKPQGPTVNQKIDQTPTKNGTDIFSSCPVTGKKPSPPPVGPKTYTRSVDPPSPPLPPKPTLHNVKR